MFANKSHAGAFELYIKKDFQEALKAFDEALLLNPLHADLYADRAFCLWHLGNFEGSANDLAKAIELQPAYAFRYSCLGFLQQLNGKKEAAKMNYTKALELDPKESVALHNMKLIDKPSVTPLINPEDIRKKILQTYIEFTKQFPNSEEQRKLIHFLKNKAK
jgi:Flp pilus assembly protein TadD